MLAMLTYLLCHWKLRPGSLKHNEVDIEFSFKKLEKLKRIQGWSTDKCTCQLCKRLTVHVDSPETVPWSRRSAFLSFSCQIFVIHLLSNFCNFCGVDIFCKHSLVLIVCSFDLSRLFAFISIFFRKNFLSFFLLCSFGEFLFNKSLNN